MFWTSRVYHQEDHLYMQFFMVCFQWVYVSNLAGGRMCSMHGTKKHKVHNIRYLCLWYSFLFKAIHFKSNYSPIPMLHPLLNMCRCLLIWHNAHGCGCGCSTLMMGSNFCPLKLTFKQWEYPEITGDKGQGLKGGCSIILPQMSAITNTTSCTVCDNELS